MSYTILYRRLFVKMPDGTFVALVQSGDNNVYDTDLLTGRERRSRSWSSWHFCSPGDTPKASYGEAEILAWLGHRGENARRQAERSPVTWEKDYGWLAGYALHGRRPAMTTWGMFRNFFLAGMRNAVPFDRFTAMCSPMSVSFYSGHLFRRLAAGNTAGSLTEAFSSALKAADEALAWVEPTCTASLINALADIVFGGRGTVRMQMRGEDGGMVYVRTLFPLTTTPDREAAGLFPNSLFTGDADAVRVLRAQAPHARDICYGTTV